MIGIDAERGTTRARARNDTMLICIDAHVSVSICLLLLPSSSISGSRHYARSRPFSSFRPVRLVPLRFVVLRLPRVVVDLHVVRRVQRKRAANRVEHDASTVGPGADTARGSDDASSDDGQHGPIRCRRERRVDDSSSVGSRKRTNGEELKDEAKTSERDEHCTIIIVASFCYCCHTLKPDDVTSTYIVDNRVLRA